MSKSKIIGDIRTRGERDLKISDGALRLLLRICSHAYYTPRWSLDNCFALPWSQVAVWCGVAGRENATRRITELIEENYLKCDGLRGCPPTNYYFLVSKCPENRTFERTENRAIERPKKRAIVCPENRAHHNNNSFQEERFKERGKKSSLRSEYGMGDEIAQGDAVRVQGVQVLREFLKTNKRP